MLHNTKTTASPQI